MCSPVLEFTEPRLISAGLMSEHQSFGIEATIPSRKQSDGVTPLHDELIGGMRHAMVCCAVSWFEYPTLVAFDTGAARCCKAPMAAS